MEALKRWFKRATGRQWLARFLVVSYLLGGVAAGSVVRSSLERAERAKLEPVRSVLVERSPESCGCQAKRRAKRVAVRDEVLSPVPDPAFSEGGVR